MRVHAPQEAQYPRIALPYHQAVLGFALGVSSVASLLLGDREVLGAHACSVHVLLCSPGDDAAEERAAAKGSARRWKRHYQHIARF